MAASFVFRCPSCGQANRVPVARLNEGPKCGSCKSTLPPPREPVEVSDADLEATVAESPLPVVVDFWAPWCGPCQMIGPVLEKLSSQLAGQVVIAKLNVDDNPAMAQRYQAKAIPMLVGFSGGKPVAKQVGALSPQGLKAWVEKVISGLGPRAGAGAAHFLWRRRLCSTTRAR